MTTSCAIIATSNYCSEKDLQIAERNVKKLGFDKIERFIPQRRFFKKWAGSPNERLNFFKKAWNSNSKVIMVCRGGSGLAQFVGKINFPCLKKRRKLLVGYSDVTLLLNLMYQRTGIIGLHGPMAIKKIDKPSAKALKDALQMKKYGIAFDEKNILIPGKNIEGIIMGGNIRSIAEGFRHSIRLDFTNKIIFLEDKEINEYRLFNLLYPIRNNKFFRPKAILLGNLEIGYSKMVKKMLKYLFPKTPIIINLPFGHELPNITIPVGANCRVDFEKQKIQFNFPDSAKKYAIELSQKP